jgi:hypothetical protein
MDKETFLSIIKQNKEKTTIFNFYARQAELKNLIQLYAGQSNPFYEAAQKVNFNATYSSEYLDSIFKTFFSSVEQDLISKISLERKIKIEVVNHCCPTKLVLAHKFCWNY